MDHSLTFMYFLGLLFAPICAIGIVDYYLFRRQKLDMVALFDNRVKSKYGFWAGINPAAFAAVAAGFFTYWYLLDPVTYVSHWTTGFKWISASLPSLVVSAVVYWAVTRLVVIPLKKWGYERYFATPAAVASAGPVSGSEPTLSSVGPEGPEGPEGGATID